MKPSSLLPFFCQGEGMGPTNQPQQMFMPHHDNHRIPQVTDDRDLGVPLDTTFTALAHGSWTLRIQQDDCFSWSAGLSRNYLNFVALDCLCFPYPQILISLGGHCCPPRPILPLLNNYPILCVPQTSPPHYVFLSIL